MQSGPPRKSKPARLASLGAFGCITLSGISFSFIKVDTYQDNDLGTFVLCVYQEGVYVMNWSKKALHARVYFDHEVYNCMAVSTRHQRSQLHWQRPQKRNLNWKTATQSILRVLSRIYKCQQLQLLYPSYTRFDEAYQPSKSSASFMRTLLFQIRHRFWP
jgi:hypothetical protein